MSRLRVSGLVRPQVDSVSVVARPRTQPHSRLSANPSVPARASNPGPTARSFVPFLTRQGRDSVHSLSEPRNGSRLSLAGPTQRPSFMRHSIVEERRAARQARDRPWAPQRSTSPTESRLSTRTSKPTIPDSKRPTARTGYVRAKPEAPAKGGRKAKSGKTVRFAEETSNVSFGCRRTVTPVTRWIEKAKHVHVPLRLRKRVQAPSTAQVDKKSQSLPARQPRSALRRKPVRNVHFGEDSVESVTRWIDPLVDVHPEPAGTRGRQLQGWSVTPLPKPDKHGLTEKYTSYWGSRPYVKLRTHSKTSCDHGLDCIIALLAYLQLCFYVWFWFRSGLVWFSLVWMGLWVDVLVDVILLLFVGVALDDFINDLLDAPLPSDAADFLREGDAG
ncbi:hypothetical protein BJY04DRAFT_204416 [Aspergillus karnatakaensis]|uniref:uncharacterized protein n=1 Tax=Aspergillus karnatakaensis TaxID=1810916 RepID=UPI003CCD8809